jgi:manganese/zinc/iron transport system permease protein
MTLIFFKEFVLICFDRDFAAVQGYPVNLLEIFLMILMCLCVAAGLPAVGAVLVVALLIFPPVTARIWSAQIKTVVMLSGALGSLCCVCGVSLSAITPSDYISGGLPTGPIIVVCAALLLSASLIAKALIRLINKPTNQLAQKTQSGEPC